MHSLLRRVLRRLSRDRVLVRRLPPAFASTRVYVTPDSALRFWRRELGPEERLLLDWAGELVAPGAVVWDVGANVGLFSFGAAARAGPSGHVVALEPDPFLGGLLRRTEAGRPAGTARVEILEAAACDRAGPVLFHVAAAGRASSHIEDAGQTTTGGSRQILEVPGVTLDGLRADYGRPSVVKVDVEGAEARVLRGAERLLTIDRPALLCEVSAATRDHVSRELRRLEYRLFDAETTPGERVSLPTAPWNTLALPGEAG